MSKIYPLQNVLREGTDAKFCCVPPPGVSIVNFTVTTQYNKEYLPFTSVGAGVKAIAVKNLTIQQDKGWGLLTLSCTDTARFTKFIFNYVGCKFLSVFVLLFSVFLLFFNIVFVHIFISVCSSSSPEAQKLQLFHLKHGTCNLHLGSWQKTKHSSHQSYTNSPHRVSTRAQHSGCVC